MAKSIQERVRAAQAAQDKARKALEDKASAPERRSQAARFAAQVRKDNRVDALIDGREEPRTAAEFRLIDCAEIGEAFDDKLSLYRAEY